MKKFVWGILIVFMVLYMNSCSLFDSEPGPKPEHDQEVKIPKEFWGNWVALTKEGFLSSGAYNIYTPYETALSITENTINKETIGAPNKYQNNPRYGYVGVSFEKLTNINPNMVYFECMKYYNSGYTPLKLYLFPMYSGASSFTGNVVGFDNLPSRANNVSSRAVSGIGGMGIVVSNLDKAGQTATATTDSNGNFTVNGIIPGDTYEVNVGDQKIQFTPVANGDNMGTITVTDGVNFKTTYSGSDAKRYTTRNYPITIYMKNTGTARASGTTYKITLDDGLTPVSGSSNLTGIMGTVEPSGTGNIQLTIKCDSVQGDYEWKKLFIEIYDPLSQKTWNDSVSILFHASAVTIELYPPYDRIDNRMDNRLSFAVLSPDGECHVPSPILYHFGLMQYVLPLKMEIPLLQGDYTIVVHGREGVYEISDNINGRSKETASQFTDTGRYKPNQTVSQAVTVQLPIMAYMIKDTFDFYKIRYK
ncbi:MAG: carboxypeptidase-like regulatory domain-containing protein [Treponema sp.]|nr:carboxypeptidase-like regulatory domain-containing protein [Treponema sp.]